MRQGTWLASDYTNDDSEDVPALPTPKPPSPRPTDASPRANSFVAEARARLREEADPQPLSIVLVPSAPSMANLTAAPSIAVEPVRIAPLSVASPAPGTPRGYTPRTPDETPPTTPRTPGEPPPLTPRSDVVWLAPAPAPLAASIRKENDSSELDSDEEEELLLAAAAREEAMLAEARTRVLLDEARQAKVHVLHETEAAAVVSSSDNPTGGMLAPPSSALLDTLLSIKTCNDTSAAPTAAVPRVDTATRPAQASPRVATKPAQALPARIDTATKPALPRVGVATKPAQALSHVDTPTKRVQSSGTLKPMARQKTRGPADAVWGGGGPVEHAGWDFQITAADWDAFVAASRASRPAAVSPTRQQPARPKLQPLSVSVAFDASVPVKDLPGRERGKLSRARTSANLNVKMKSDGDLAGGVRVPTKLSRASTMASCNTSKTDNFRDSEEGQIRFSV